MNPLAPKNSIANTLKSLAILLFVTLALALPGLSNVPVIDRDEARYTQASVQMAESGDYINIRFQDRARNKKPAGVYWMQTLMIKVVAKPGERHLWAQRIPSVLGALLAVWATYWGGLAFLSRRAALMSALFLAMSFSLVFEAHIAKTDALLCGFSALALASLLHMRRRKDRKLGLIFWSALGAATMIKGPVLLAIVGLTLLALLIWERSLKAFKPLLFWAGPLLFLLIVLPWVWMIWHATDGLFFQDAIGGDLGSKLGGAQEKHGGPIGYYTLTLWVFFWPACLFLPLAATSLYNQMRKPNTKTPSTKTPSTKTKEDQVAFLMIRLLLCWFIPFFILLELIPTKLPHYPLPLYPALALLCACAIHTVPSPEVFKKSRILGSVIFSIIWVLLAAGLLTALFIYGPALSVKTGVIALFFLGSALTGTIAMIGLQKNEIEKSVKSLILSAGLLMVPAYAIVLPSLTTLRIADQVSARFQDLGIKPPRLGGSMVLSPHFTEPSLIYTLGKDVRLGDQVNFLNPTHLNLNTVILLDLTRKNASDIKQDAERVLQSKGLCLTEHEVVDGFNYSKGDPVSLAILQALPCKRH